MEKNGNWEIKAAKASTRFPQQSCGLGQNVSPHHHLTPRYSVERLGFGSRKVPCAKALAHRKPIA